MGEFIKFNYLAENGLLGLYWTYSAFWLLAFFTFFWAACTIMYCKDGLIAKGICFGILAGIHVAFVIYLVQTYFL